MVGSIGHIRNDENAHVIPLWQRKTSAPPAANMRAIPGHVLAVDNMDILETLKT
jgi:hypothetical protein